MGFLLKVNNWWNTTCSLCLKIRIFLREITLFFFYVLGVITVLCFGLFVYWILFDNSPVIHYGTNARAEFYKDRIIFHLDATRMRDCPAIIYRKISGCGQIDLPETHAVTVVGGKAPPVSFPLDLLFQAFSKEQLSGNVCTLVSTAIGYCNPAQRLLKIPIVTQSKPITFIPVPRSQTWPDQPKQEDK